MDIREENDLIEKARAGDRLAVATLFAPHDEKLRSMAFQITRNQEDADDVKQDTFLKACSEVGGFRGESRFGTWLYRIAANFAYALNTKKGRRRETSIPDDLIFEDSAPKDGHAENPSHLEIETQVEQELKALEAALPEGGKAAARIRTFYRYRCYNALLFGLMAENLKIQSYKDAAIERLFVEKENSAPTREDVETMKNIIKQNWYVARKDREFNDWYEDRLSRRDALAKLGAGALAFIFAGAGGGRTFNPTPPDLAEFAEFDFHELHDAISAQSYTYQTTNANRERLRAAKDPRKLLDFASEIIIDVWMSEPSTAGILCTLLSTCHDLWGPSKDTLDKLKELCKRVFDAGHLGLVASAEPLAFALAVKGSADIHRTCLGKRVEDRDWREADARRVELYYGSHWLQMPAINRHLGDPFRAGVLRANDTSLLMHLSSVSDPQLRRRAKELLTTHASVLSHCGEDRLLRSVQRCLEADDMPGN